MYQAVYKCRLCGEKLTERTVSEDEARSINAALNVYGHTRYINCDMNLFKNITHACEDGSYGIADFQGFKKME